VLRFPWYAHVLERLKTEAAILYTRIRAKLFGYMRSDARAWATSHFESLLEDAGNFEYEPVLKHGDDFLRRCAAAYGDIKPLLRRIRYHRGTFALLEALFGIENGDEEAFRAGIEQYV